MTTLESCPQPWKRKWCPFLFCAIFLVTMAGCGEKPPEVTKSMISEYFWVPSQEIHDGNLTRTDNQATVTFAIEGVYPLEKEIESLSTHYQDKGYKKITAHPVFLDVDLSSVLFHWEHASEASDTSESSSTNYSAMWENEDGEFVHFQISTSQTGNNSTSKSTFFAQGIWLNKAGVEEVTGEQDDVAPKYVSVERGSPLPFSWSIRALSPTVSEMTTQRQWMGQDIFLLPTPIASEEDITSGLVAAGPSGDLELALQLDEDGAAALLEASKNTNQRVAVLFNDKVVHTAVFSTELPGGRISFPVKNLSQEETQILEKMFRP